MARPRYTFLKNKNLPDLKWSLGFSALSGTLLLVMLLISYFRQGAGIPLAGAFGLGGLLLAGYSFVVSMRILVRRPEQLRLPAFCVLFSGSMFIGWLSLFLLGLGS